MPYLQTWREFAHFAEELYMKDPMKARYTMKYRHCDGKLVVKMTDNVDCLMYVAENSQEVKKVAKFISRLMQHMASKEK